MRGMSAQCADEVWRPLVLDAASPETEERLRGLVADGTVRCVHDTLDRQVRDLVRTRRCGRRVTEEELASHVDDVTAGLGLEAYGSWVHYPWSGRLVRVLPSGAFRELRLDRNRNKITVDEQRRLRDTTVGIVGLSVGNAAALTLTMEGACGHLKLADFDELELSNLNRLRAGVHEIGVPKVVLAARQIFEIDPYASLSLLPAGVTCDNVEQFLAEPPRVDIVVDECDSIDVKFLLRERARAHRIPVVMETSDRGLIDIERFDLEPERPLFHGLCGDASAVSVARHDRAEQLALVLRIVDAESVSARAAASLLEIDTTLSTWPQLASEVALGGSTITAAVRELALGRPVPSGRAYVDVATALAGACDPLLRSPDAPVPGDVRFVLERAILAPSGGNCQPWRFVLEDHAIELRLDRSRSRSLLDASRHASYLALGAAIENAVVAGASAGLHVQVEPFPDAGDPAKAAVLRLEAGGDHALGRLLPAVEQRTTNRDLGAQTPPDASERAQLTEAAAAHGAHLELLTERPLLDEAAALIGAADRIRFLSPALHADLVGELRWSDEEARESGDGIDVATLALGAADRAALRLVVRADTAAALRETDGGAALARMAGRAVDGAGAVGLLRADGSTPAAWLRAGRALERMWLVATELGLALQPMTALPYLVELVDLPEGSAVEPRDRLELQALGARLGDLFAAHRECPPALLFRLASGVPPPRRRSARRPLADVLSVRPSRSKAHG
jgi:molybdopterin/thiamine biosynthesis adenylyltransferase/nitroreductase